jgi:hypothetical protein
LTSAILFSRILLRRRCILDSSLSVYSHCFSICVYISVVNVRWWVAIVILFISFKCVLAYCLLTYKYKMYIYSIYYLHNFIQRTLYLLMQNSCFRKHLYKWCSRQWRSIQKKKKKKKVISSVYFSYFFMSFILPLEVVCVLICHKVAMVDVKYIQVTQYMIFKCFCTVWMLKNVYILIFHIFKLVYISTDGTHSLLIR